jgi:hypothetical protein
MDNVIIVHFFFYHPYNSLIFYELIWAPYEFLFTRCFENKFLKIVFLFNFKWGILILNRSI